MTITSGIDFPNLRDLIVDPIELLKAKTPEDYLALRNDVIAIIQGGVAPSGSIGNIPINTGAWTLPLSVTPYAQEFVSMTMERGVRSNAIYIRNSSPSGRLFVYSQGHGGAYIPYVGDTRTNAPDYYTAGTKALLEAVYAHGDDLMLLCMPLVGENFANSIELGLSNHNDFATYKPTHGSAVRWFTDPVSRAIDYAKSVRTYTEINAAGISGGGWTTVLTSAIDNRIKASYSIAGSTPLAFRRLRNIDLGDWEQSLAAELWANFDYLDLYLMAVAEPSRRAWHIHHQNDTCCFLGASIVGYAKDMSRYARENGFGKLRFRIDPIFVGHDVSEYDRTWILSDLYP